MIKKIRLSFCCRLPINLKNNAILAEIFIKLWSKWAKFWRKKFLIFLNMSLWVKKSNLPVENFIQPSHLWKETIGIDLLPTIGIEATKSYCHSAYPVNQQEEKGRGSTSASSAGHFSKK